MKLFHFLSKSFVVMILPLSAFADVVYIGPNATYTNASILTGTIDAIEPWGTNFGNTIINSGTINNTAGVGGDHFGIMSSGNSNTIINSGTINVTAGADGVAYGIYNAFGNCNSNTITNSGTINSVAGTNGAAYSISSYGDSNSFLNSGKINDTAIGGWAASIVFGGNSNTITNTGTINTIASGTGNHAESISSDGDSNTVTNSGTINAAARTGGAAYGIHLYGGSNTLTNSGTIIARGGDISRAIAIEAFGSFNNIVNINKGSILIGDIYISSIVWPNSGLVYSSPGILWVNPGNSLNINLGAGASYAYQTTGPWSAHDLDNRPFVSKSDFTSAAGIGVQESASQMLYQRTSTITNTLDSRVRDYMSDNKNKVNTPYWVDTYFSNSNRSTGTNNSVQTNFSNQNYGFTAGAKLPINVTPVEAIINFEQSTLNIANGSQSVSTSSVMTGLLAPKITERFGINLSSKALIGWGGHSGDRTVFTNSLMYNGTQNVTSEYDSIYGIVGNALTRSFTFTDYLRADVLAGFDINIQSVSSYSESAYFHWDDRTMTQLQSRLQAGLTTNLLNNTLSFFGRVGVEQRDLVAGQTQNYQIQGTTVTFNGGRMDNTYLTGQLGTTYDVYKKVQLFGVISSTNGLDSVQAIQGNLGLRANF